MTIRWRRIVTTLLLVLSGLAITARAEAQYSGFSFKSEPGDLIGRGRQQTWTYADATIIPVADFAGGVSLEVTAATGEHWNTQFAPTRGTTMVPGVYESAHRINWGSPALEVWARGNTGCDTIGRFEVLEVSFVAGWIWRFAADFELQCTYLDAAIVGAIRYNSTIASLEPFGGAPRQLTLTVDKAAHGRVDSTGIRCGGIDADCTETYGAASTVVLTATPDPGYLFLGWTGDCPGGASSLAVRVNRHIACRAWFNAIPGTSADDEPLIGKAAIYVDGQPGAPMLGGEHALLQSDAGALIRVRSATTSRVELEAYEADSTQSTFSFTAPEGGTLQPGLYEYAIGAPYQSPLVPGLTVVVRQTTCSPSRGRFVVHEISFAGSVLQSFSADFEYHCNNIGPGLFGSIRLNSTRGTLIPFDGIYPVYRLQIQSERGGRVVADGIDCGGDCEETYPGPTTVTLAATPDAGFEFLGWTDDCSGLSPATVSVDQARRCTAIFSRLPGTPAIPLETSVFFLDFHPMVGAIERRVWTGRSSQFTVISAAPDVVSMKVTTPEGENWTVVLAAPSGQPLTAGRVYEFASAYSTRPALRPKFTISWDPWSSAGGGRFAVHEISFDADGALSSLAVDFEQHQGTMIARYGSLRWNATRDRLSPFDGAYPTYRLQVAAERGGRIVAAGIDCGADCDEAYAVPTVVTVTAVPDPDFVFAGWSDGCTGNAATTVLVSEVTLCTAVFSPMPGTAAAPLEVDTLLFDSDPGEWFGRGERRIWTGRSSLFRIVAASSDVVRIRVETPKGEDWFIDLAAPPGEQLVAGRRYDSVQEYGSSPAPTGASLRVSNYESGVTRVSGRFVVHEVSFDGGGSLTSFAADFEQHLNGEIAGLRGSLRYHASRADLIPFAGETKTTMLFHHAVTGDLVMWVMGGWTRVAAQTPTPSRVLTNWRLAGTGDFNADGKVDWLWQEDTGGDLVVWVMDGSDQLFYRYLSIPRPADPLWKVASVADMNADGKPDLVWQHAASGALAAWMMNGTTVVDRVSLDPWVIADSNWKVVSTGDFNGDGKTDLLWKHMTSGYLIVWTMNGVTRTSVEWLSPYQLADREWQIAATGDLNGDGKVDIVFQHSDGRLVVWLMDGTIRTSFQMLSPAYVKDPNWRIIGPR